MGFTSPPPPPDRLAQILYTVSVAARKDFTSPTWDALPEEDKGIWKAVAVTAIVLCYPFSDSGTTVTNT